MSTLCECGCGRPAPIAKRTNATLGHDSTSGIRNVYPRNGKWRVHLAVQGQTKVIGTFDSIDDAEAAAIAARQQYMTHADHR